MKKYTAIIVDDEDPGRKNLSSLLFKYCPEIQVIAESDDAIDAKKKIVELNPQILFLDVQMPELDGFDLLEALPEKNFSVIVVTAHAQYGIQAVKAGAVDYILKPIVIKELQQAVLKGIEHIQHKLSESITATRISLSHTNGFAIIELTQIIRFEADDNYTKVFTIENKNYLVSKPLKQFEDNLPLDIFFRLHRSHIINMYFVKEYLREDGGIVVMKDGSKILIPRSRNADFMEAIKKLSIQL